jgi:hypothetical protein
MALFFHDLSVKGWNDVAGDGVIMVIAGDHDDRGLVLVQLVRFSIFLFPLLLLNGDFIELKV